MIFSHLHFSGTFRWTSDKDDTLVKLAGQKWKEVADNSNCLQAFKDSPRDQRSVRERFQKIIDLFKAKIRKEEASPVGFLQNHSLKRSNLPKKKTARW